jgi:3-oxoacyl-[acyl-carrier-protein] synthase III
MRLKRRPKNRLNQEAKKHLKIDQSRSQKDLQTLAYLSAAAMPYSVSTKSSVGAKETY